MAVVTALDSEGEGRWVLIAGAVTLKPEPLLGAHFPP